MRKINRIFVTLVLVIIFLTAEIVVIRSAAGIEEKVGVLFAARKIQTDELITDEDLKFIEVPQELAHKFAVKSKEQAVGRRAKTDIEEGEMIFSTKLGGRNDFNGISITEGYRLFTLALKGDQANGWKLKAGQRVDIILVREKNSGIGSNATERLCDIRVAALLGENGEVVREGVEGISPRYVCLEVKKGQDEFLARASRKDDLNCPLCRGGTK